MAEFIGMANVVELSRLRALDGHWVGESQLGPISIEAWPMALAPYDVPPDVIRRDAYGARPA